MYLTCLWCEMGSVVLDLIEFCIKHILTIFSELVSLFSAINFCAVKSIFSFLLNLMRSGNCDFVDSIGWPQLCPCSTLSTSGNLSLGI